MTYCVAIKLKAGLVFLSDSRTNAGLDQISTFRKLIVYEKPDDRFMVLLSAGNFIEATPETPYFQVGESKYGKPVLDRVITPDTPLDEAAKCALVSMDSTLKSNLSVGLPLDMVIYEADQFQSDKVVCIDDDNPYFRMLHGSWGQKLREVFDSIEDPMWNGEHTQVPLMVNGGRNRPLRKIGTPQEKLI